MWLCPHRLFKHPVKAMIGPENEFWLQKRPGDTESSQMWTDIGLYFAPGPVLRGEKYDGDKACAKLEQWLIEINGFQVEELTFLVFSIP